MKRQTAAYVSPQMDVIVKKSVDIACSNGCGGMNVDCKPDGSVGDGDFCEWGDND